jgi:hypothetical protein
VRHLRQRPRRAGRLVRQAAGARGPQPRARHRIRRPDAAQGGPTLALLSHRGSPAVPSPKRGLTSVFGMGTGVAPALWRVGKPGWDLSFDGVGCPHPVLVNFARPRLAVCTAEAGACDALGQSNSVEGSPRHRVRTRSPWGMVKPHGRLVPVSSTHCCASTSGLSTSSSRTALQGTRSEDRNSRGDLILGWASHLDAFSGYPIGTWLPGGAPGGTTGTPEVPPSRSSRTRDSSPQISYAHSG